MRPKHLIALASLVTSVLAMAGCRQDMHDQPRYKPLAATDFFGDGRSARPAIEGTVARGHLRIDKARYTGKKADGTDIDAFPFSITQADLLRGQQRFNIFCSPCHSRVGDGNGMVVRRGFRQAASYHTAKLIKAPIGHFFDVMTNGFGAMPSYASRVEPDDRWRIAAYIRVLQLSQNAGIEDVPPDQRAQLEKDSMTPSNSLTAQIGRWQRNSLLVGVVGALLAIVACLLDREQFLRSYLFAYLYWTGMALGCLAILLMHHVVGGKWGMLIRRLCEAGARTLPFMAILLIPILLGITILYPWARPEAAHDANIQSKAMYLNIPFFIARAIFYFAVWFLYSHLLSKWSADQDRTGDDRLIGRMRAFSAPGLVVFTLTTTFAFIDWVMSLEPHWFSTIYGAMFMVGEMVESFAFVIALLIILSKAPPIRDYVTPQHIHDLGNMMFAFMVLWAYLSFSQFLIIWSGNLPEEIPWYLSRLRGGWGWVALAIVIFHFAVPFGLLLFRATKRREDRLLGVCALMIVIRLADVYWITEPAFFGQQFRIHWTDFVTPLAVGGLWLALFFWQLKARPLLPLRDPRLEGAPRETVAF